jgi:hypothetical protein
MRHIMRLKMPELSGPAPVGLRAEPNHDI